MPIRSLRIFLFTILYCDRLLHHLLVAKRLYARPYARLLSVDCKQTNRGMVLKDCTSDLIAFLIKVCVFNKLLPLAWSWRCSVNRVWVKTLVLNIDWVLWEIKLIINTAPLLLQLILQLFLFLVLLVLVRKGININVNWLFNFIIFCSQLFNWWSDILLFIPMAVFASNLRRSALISALVSVVVINVYDLFLVAFVFPLLLTIAGHCLF
jgi:hypothetical protein